MSSEGGSQKRVALIAPETFDIMSFFNCAPGSAAAGGPSDQVRAPESQPHNETEPPIPAEHWERRRKRAPSRAEPGGTGLRLASSACTRGCTAGQRGACVPTPAAATPTEAPGEASHFHTGIDNAEGCQKATGSASAMPADPERAAEPGDKRVRGCVRRERRRRRGRISGRLSSKNSRSDARRSAGRRLGSLDSHLLRQWGHGRRELRERRRASVGRVFVGRGRQLQQRRRG